MVLLRCVQEGVRGTACVSLSREPGAAQTAGTVSQAVSGGLRAAQQARGG